MKMNRLTLAVGLMFGTLSLTGCQKDTSVSGEPRSQKLTLISSVAETETRTVMEGDKAAGFNTAWSQNADKLGVYTYNADAAPGTLTQNVEFGIVSVNEGAATFEGAVNYDTTDRTYDLYAYYPRSSAGGAHTAVAAYIAGIQTMPANGTHDPANDYMVALPGQLVEVKGGELMSATLDKLQFRYLVGFMNLSVPAVTATDITSADEVESIKITAGGAALSGDFTLDLTDGNMTFATTSNEVTVTLPAGVTLGNLNAWAVVNPFTLTQSDNLIFEITTATHIIAKQVPLTDGFVMGAGVVKTFGMTIDDSCTITTRGSGGPKVIFSETFDVCAGSQAPTSGTTLDTTAYGTIPSDLATVGWTAGNWQSGLGCARISAASAVSRWVTTPALAGAGAAPVDVVLTFKAYNGATNEINLNVTATDAGTVTGGTITLPAGVATGSVIPDGTGIESCSYTVRIAGVTSATKITIDSKAQPTGRFYIDDIIVTTVE